MNRHLDSEEISAWIIGERSADSQRHIAECAQCRGEIGHLDNAFAHFRESARQGIEHCHSVRVSPFRFVAEGVLALATLAAILLVQRPSQAEEPFLEIPYITPLAPYERTSVMRMDVPVTALIAAGFEVHAHEPGGAVTVDVLLGQDGRAHAFRPIDRSITQ